MELVERLRAASRDDRLATGMLYRDAADEIERLRGQRDAAIAAAQDVIIEQRDEIGRLRDENARAEKTLHRMRYLHCEHCGGWHRTLGTQLCGKEKA